MTTEGRTLLTAPELTQGSPAIPCPRWREGKATVGRGFPGSSGWSPGLCTELV